MEILKHRLVDGGVQHLVCRKNSRKLSGSDMIVVHYTAGTSA
ncbi:MAG TPA: N-acetylmuramoyl-L-alanine amidase, partial [Odoribacter splanchnicus]|nr:N-acetylmuramoyl-L-alanine amidase [Odoribacter splanchnicus]